MIAQRLMGRGLRQPSGPWWLAGGVDSAVCVAAYAPKGAATLADSYKNVNNPGTNDAVPLTAPTLTSDGWTFNGTSQYLGVAGTDCRAGASWSQIIRFSNAANRSSELGVLVGGSEVNARFYLRPNETSSSSRFGYGSSAASSRVLTSGIMAQSAARCFIDGGFVANVAGSWANLSSGLTIGRRHIASSSDYYYYKGNVQAYAIYSAALTDAQIAAISTEMAKL